MMEETHLINNVKERCCFVSQDFSADLERMKFKKGGEVKYVLPDYSNSKEGYVLAEGQTVQDTQQVLVLGNERFTIPEILFTPSDVGRDPCGNSLIVGSKQGGIAEAVMQSVNAAPEEFRSLLLANIVLVGGTCKLPGFTERLCIPPVYSTNSSQREIRSMAPANHLVQLTMSTEYNHSAILLISVP